MRTKRLTVLILVVLVLGLAGISKAGVDPEPFRWPAIRLNVIGFVLENIEARLDEILDRPPPDDNLPPPDDNRPGLVALRLNIMAARLTNLNRRVEAVLGSPPDDIIPPDYFMAAVLRVGDAAQSIAVRAREGFSGPPPDDNRVLNALERVESAAQDIVTTVNEYLATLPPRPSLPPQE